MFHSFGLCGFVWVLAWFLLFQEDPHLALRDSVRDEASPVPWGDVLRSPAVWAICAAHCADNWGSYFLTSWLPTYFAEEHGNLPIPARVTCAHCICRVYSLGFAFDGSSESRKSSNSAIRFRLHAAAHLRL
jgi:hypothetical protein